MSYFSTPDSYERVYLSFDPMHRLMQERNITDLQLAQKVGVKVDVIRNTYKYLDTVTLFHGAEHLRGPRLRPRRSDDRREG